MGGSGKGGTAAGGRAAGGRAAGGERSRPGPLDAATKNLGSPGVGRARCWLLAKRTETRAWPVRAEEGPCPRPISPHVASRAGGLGFAGRTGAPRGCAGASGPANRCRIDVAGEQDGSLLPWAGGRVRSGTARWTSRPTKHHETTPALVGVRCALQSSFSSPKKTGDPLCLPCATADATPVDMRAYNPPQTS